jgi:hypothetical protein
MALSKRPTEGGLASNALRIYNGPEKVDKIRKDAGRLRPRAALL